MPETIKHFSQCVALTPQFWDTADTITSQFEHEGHKSYFINTIVSYVQSLHDILHLWRIRAVTNQVADLSSLSLYNRCTRCHLINLPYLPTSPQPFPAANLFCPRTTILTPLTPIGKNTAFFWGTLGQENPKF